MTPEVAASSVVRGILNVFSEFNEVRYCNTGIFSTSAYCESFLYPQPQVALKLKLSRRESNLSRRT